MDDDLTVRSGRWVAVLARLLGPFLLERALAYASGERTSKMRIRKQPRQLPACRDSFLPCSFQEGVGWSGRECSEVVNGGDVEKASIEHVKPDSDVASGVSRMMGQLQSGEGHGVHGVDHRELQNGKAPFMSHRDLVACGQSSSAVEGMEIVTSHVDRMKLPAPSNYLESSFTQEEYDDDDDNLTRHYVRRGLRSSGDGATQNRSEENVPVEDVEGVIPKVNLPAY